METDEKYQLLAKVSSAFSPSAPINSADLFAGRTKQVEQATTALFQRGQHVILFGERGVGKTSLANTIYDLLYSALAANDVRLARFNCSAETQFGDLWKGILRELELQENHHEAGFGPRLTVKTKRLDTFLPS